MWGTAFIAASATALVVGHTTESHAQTGTTFDQFGLWNTRPGSEYAQMSNLTVEMGGLIGRWLTDYLWADGANGQSAEAIKTYVWSPELEQLAASRELAGETDWADPRETQEAVAGRRTHRAPGTISFWHSGGVLWGDGDSDPSNGAPGFDQFTWAMTSGADIQVTEQFLIGGAGLTQRTKATFDGGSETKIKSYQLGIYGSYDTGTLYVDMQASGGYADIETHRQVYIPMVVDTKAFSDTGAWIYTAGAEVGYVFQFDDGFWVQPMVGLDYVHASISGFTETEAGPYNLTVDDSDANSLTSRLGFSASGDFQVGDMRLSPEVRAAWQHEFLDTNESITAAFVSQPGSSFTATGADYGSDAALVGAGLNLKISEKWDVFVDYNGLFASGYTANAISGGFRIVW